ncbi:conserved exported protein of unknown function [Mizugakiibacter sediminis]|uniref:Acetate kinase n=1 Tax=Mizugakiibacter sediminis TaxID=1475481 RepID=A0A0K8QK27_9GAMM|nr:acetate kinase [Mizugakiibacter sediminis]GAP65164.1 conserved exported protein of unknown function [Mizugakiibacter sediminis]
MNHVRTRCIGTLGCLTLAVAAGLAQAQDAPADDAGSDARYAALRQDVDAHIARLEALKRELAEQEAALGRLQHALDEQTLAKHRGGTGRGAAPQAAGAQAQTEPAPPSRPVGQAPESATRPPEVAPIFDQPGVLTPRRKFVLEPSLQYGYSSSDRVALVGYTIIPALLIGLIDVREVKTTTLTAALTGRYGLTNRLEVELRVPYVHSSGDTVSREVFTGTAVDRVFHASGSDIGDAEFTVRYQLNRGDYEKPFYVGWVRFKSRTGRDPFEVTTDCVQRCVGNTTGTGLPLELPTGSGFYAVQPGLTWLYASDPAVLFGSISYLHNFARDNVSRHVLDGNTEFLGKVRAGDIIEFNLGLGLALNEKASLSIGYDQSIVGTTKQNGQTVPGSVRTTLGTLLVGVAYRINDTSTLNMTLGAGLTRDTPDVLFTVRLPMTF